MTTDVNATKRSTKRLRTLTMGKLSVQTPLDSLLKRNQQSKDMALYVVPW